MPIGNCIFLCWLSNVITLGIEEMVLRKVKKEKLPKACYSAVCFLLDLKYICPGNVLVFDGTL